MSPLVRAALVRLVFGACATGACTGAASPAPSPIRPSASAAADTLGDHYAALERVADSIVLALSPRDDAPSELSQVTARNIAGRIQALSEDYGALSVAMRAADYERGVSLWMRLALAQAGLEMLQEDAFRLGEDPATGPADMRDLADRLSGVLELGRVTGREASRMFGAPAGQRRDYPNTCTRCSPTLPSQS
ncbi:MAG TPA: hypothetical protein VMY76_10545 [Gemmatimonadales bacterium]|nr:hypothetical protein [Gemmatimonadales bacterium]